MTEDQFATMQTEADPDLLPVRRDFLPSAGKPHPSPTLDRQSKTSEKRASRKLGLTSPTIEMVLRQSNELEQHSKSWDCQAISKGHSVQTLDNPGNSFEAGSGKTLPWSVLLQVRARKRVSTDRGHSSSSNPPIRLKDSTSPDSISVR